MLSDDFERSRDRQNYAASLLAAPDFVRNGYQAGLASERKLSPTGLLFAGMGFSGITANLVKDSATRAIDLPFTIVKHYQFPNHVREGWHTLAISYSGETEETLSVVKDSLARNVPVTAFTTGGTLATLTDHNVEQPVGHQPRAALPYTWFSVLGMLESCGLLNGNVPADAAATAMEAVQAEVGFDVPEETNAAKQLARSLVNHIPQIYATPSMYGVGLHFRGMLNENAKKIADVDLIPEANHNDLTGWSGDEIFRRHFACLALSHAEQNPEIRKRLAFMKETYTGWGVPWNEWTADPIHSFEEHVVQQARAIHFLDHVSYYIAMLRRVDPSEIKDIKALKDFLRSS